MAAERDELQRQLAAERVALTKKLDAAQAEMARVAGDQQKKQAELKTAQGEIARMAAEQKKLLAERLIEMFRPFREVRAELSPEKVNAILEDGSVKAREVARQTLVEARRAVGLPPYLDR